MTKAKAVDIFADFAVTDDAVYVPYSGNVEFLIARADNPKFSKKLSNLYLKNKRIIDAGTDTSDAKSEEILIEAYAESVLLGWKGAVKFKGEDLPYSKDNAKILLSVPLFREWVTAQAKDTSAYKVVQEEETVKN